MGQVDLCGQIKLKQLQIHMTHNILTNSVSAAHGLTQEDDVGVGEAAWSVTTTSEKNKHLIV